jgi:hypothetical protein
MTISPLGPRRDVDLEYSRASLLSRAEKILAWSRQRAAASIITDWGILIDQSSASRKWPETINGPIQRCHLLNLIELDEFGTHALVSHQIRQLPEKTWVALCPWFQVPNAATALRIRTASHLNPYTAADLHASLSTSALNLPERPANDNRIPACCKVRCGTLLRFDPDTAKKAETYFNLPESFTCSEPAIIELGVDSCLVRANAENGIEPLRLILCRQLFVDTATKELARWLKSLGRARS